MRTRSAGARTPRPHGLTAREDCRTSAAPGRGRRRWPAGCEPATKRTKRPPAPSRARQAGAGIRLRGEGRADSKRLAGARRTRSRRGAGGWRRTDGGHHGGGLRRVRIGRGGARGAGYARVGAVPCGTGYEGGGAGRGRHLEIEHEPRTVPQRLRGQSVIGVRRQPRIDHAGHGVTATQVLRERTGVVATALRARIAVKQRLGISCVLRATQHPHDLGAQAIELSGSLVPPLPARARDRQRPPGLQAGAGQGEYQTQRQRRPPRPHPAVQDTGRHQAQRQPSNTMSSRSHQAPAAPRARGRPRQALERRRYAGPMRKVQGPTREPGRPPAQVPPRTRTDASPRQKREIPQGTSQKKASVGPFA